MYRHAQTDPLKNIKPSLRRMAAPPESSQFGGTLPDRAAKPHFVRSLRSAILAFWQGVNTVSHCDKLHNEAQARALQIAYRAGIRL